MVEAERRRHGADNSNAREMHRRVERWALDEVAVPGKLFKQITGWLYRENRLCREILSIGGTLVVPASLSIPTLAIVNTADKVAAAHVNKILH